MSENLSLIEDPPIPGAVDQNRTKSGALKSSVLKAIQWFVIDSGQRPVATSAYPKMTFVDRDGEHHSHDIETIKQRYAEFRRKNFGKKTAS